MSLACKLAILLMAHIALGATIDPQQCVLMCDQDQANPLCVTQAMKCDHNPDCYDMKDEEDCGCRGFLCDPANENGQCIPLAEKCDGRTDCANKRDEMICTKKDYRLTHPSFSDEKLCLKPCDFGSCEFGPSGLSWCKCKPKFFGEFCEKSEDAEDLKNSAEVGRAETKLAADTQLLGGLIASTTPSGSPTSTVPESTTQAVPSTSAGPAVHNGTHPVPPTPKEEGSGIGGKIMIPLVVLAVAGVLVWLLISKPWSR